jgi:hypothetical protein
VNSDRRESKGDSSINRLKLTYEMAPNPPSPLAWDTYSSQVMAKWSTLLQSDESRNERTMQQFLEQHPSMVPMAPLAHHDPFPCALISQPPLTGLMKRVPDFMWIGRNSTTIFAHAIEIETPHKKWFTAAGQVTAELTQAMGQLRDWQKWFEDHGKMYFYELFRVPLKFRQFRSFRPIYTLIYGSRSEFDDVPHRNEERARLESNLRDTSLMTFDRLKPIYEARNYMSVRYDGASYKAVSFPAVITLGPGRAEARSLIRDKEMAVLANPDIDTARKQFLIERLKYWDEWVKTGQDNGYRAGTLYE